MSMDGHDDAEGRMDALETRALTKLYGSTRAVDALDMHVPQGCIYGFVGKNGSGKSTTMKLVSGLVTPTSGEVLLLGRPQTPDVPIGVLIETPGLIGNLSAWDNLMAKATALGVVRAKAQCRALLDLVGLNEVGKRHVKGFSLGMKQRLGIALALVGTPNLLLLDEPLNGLDPEATRTMREMLQRLAANRNMTIVISSHVIDQLNRVVDRFGVISRGHIVREFTDEEMRAACGDAIYLRTTDPSRTVAVLGRAFPSAHLSLGDAGTISITPAASGGLPATEDVARILHTYGLVTLEMGMHSRDIEDFFVELMEKGGAHA